MQITLYRTKTSLKPAASQLSEKNAIRLFEDKKIRTAWDEEQEEWYFSVQDVVAVLAESSDPKQYIKKMRARDPELSANWGTICTPVQMSAADGKMRKIQAADTEGLLRIIQSIPSPKAEPFKRWLAKVGRERIEETIDPEQAIDRALETYQKKGYDTDWIHQRLLSIRVRNELTAEWQERGVQQGKEYAILTDEITKAWSGMSTRQYKKLKGLKKENLRDNMSTMEIVLNMLAEATTTELSKAHQPEGFSESQAIARRGGSYAGQVRQDIEKDTGRSVITSQNAAQLNAVVVDVIESVAETKKTDNKKIHKKREYSQSDEPKGGTPVLCGRRCLLPEGGCIFGETTKEKRAVWQKGRICGKRLARSGF